MDKRHLWLICFVLLLLLGTVVFLYPVISNWFNDHNATKAIDDYDERVAALQSDQRETEIRKARIYNDYLKGTIALDTSEERMDFSAMYESILDFDGVMAYLVIPKISVRLPVYHGTDGEVMKKGIGHIKSTAFPLGGEGNHTVLTGHNGLPSARLLTDLENLLIDDIFFIHILDEVHAYQVVDVNVVKPEESELLRPEYGKDYITILTCTPHAINTHRLLVRGERVEITGAESIASGEKVILAIIIILAALVISAVGLTVFLFRCFKTI